MEANQIPKQLAFDLPSRPALGKSDFFISDCNSIAVKLMEDWSSWPNRQHILSGPAGSGKTHLALVWAKSLSANVINISDFFDIDLPKVTSASLVIEDMDEQPESADLENNLLYLKGSIPGAKNSTVFLREAVKNITRKTIKEKHDAKIKETAAKKGKK